MIEIKYGNIFDSKCDFITCPTNSIGVMGKGLALQFKFHYPEICMKYNSWSKEQNPTRPYRLLIPKIYDNIIMFPTKIDWRNNSEYLYIIKGLHDLVKFLPKDKSVAFPLLGCGEGNLDPKKIEYCIRNMMKKHESLVEIWKYNAVD